MKKLVIIGANDFQNQLILKAKEMGFETHVFAWEDGAIGKENADYFYPISIIEKEAILEECRKIQPDGVCSIGSDLASITVNYIAEKLGLPGNPTKITEKCTNKYKMREALRDAGVSVPNFLKTKDINASELNNLKLPVIVKPTDRSGSRGVTKVEDARDLSIAIENAIKESFEKAAIVEEFIVGDEYSAESISYNGEHKLLAITKKHTTGAPNFIETGHEEPSGLSDGLFKKVETDVYQGLNSLGIINGASHTEFMIDKNQNIRIVEIGARMGGDCIGSDLVWLSTGYDYVKMVIQVATGEAPDMAQKTHYKKARIDFIFTKSDLDRALKITKESPEIVHRISKMETQNFGKITDSSNRVGYIITKE